MNDWVALVQMVLWPIVGLIFIIPIMKPLLEILHAIKDRIKGGAEFSAGSEGFKIGRLEDRLEEESKRLDQIRNSTENTLLSLASLVVSNPLKIPIYKQMLDQRIGEDRTIIIGCQEYTEQHLLCAIITKFLSRELHRSTNGKAYKILPKYDFGGAGQNFIALSRGDIDIYPAYTWQGLEMTFASSLQSNMEAFISLDRKQIIDKLNEIYSYLPTPLHWVGCLGFQNNWELIMPADMAEQYDIRSISDLRNFPEKFNFGCEHDYFARPNGYSLLRNPQPRGYGIQFNDVKIFKNCELYNAMADHEVDIIDGFTTDPLIRDKKYTILRDDEKRFGDFFSSMVVRKDLMDTCPELIPVLSRLENTLDALQISNMIREAEWVNAEKNKTAYIATVENIADRFIDTL